VAIVQCSGRGSHAGLQPKCSVSSSVSWHPGSRPEVRFPKSDSNAITEELELLGSFSLSDGCIATVGWACSWSSHELLTLSASQARRTTRSSSHLGTATRYRRSPMLTHSLELAMLNSPNRVMALSWGDLPSPGHIWYYQASQAFDRHGGECIVHLDPGHAASHKVPTQVPMPSSGTGTRLPRTASYI
jgi:hypothetical protein